MFFLKSVQNNYVFDRYQENNSFWVVRFLYYKKHVLDTDLMQESNFQNTDDHDNDNDEETTIDISFVVIVIVVAVFTITFPVPSSPLDHSLCKVMKVDM